MYPRRELVDAHQHHQAGDLGLGQHRARQDQEQQQSSGHEVIDLNRQSAELTSSTGYVDTPKKETNSEFLDYGFPMAVLFNQTAETLTQEFRLVSTNDSELQWIVGAFFVDAESEAGGFLQLDLSGWGLPITDQYIGDPIEMETMAIYAEIDYAFNEEWSMQFGLRAQDQERDSSSISIYRIPGDPLFGPYSYPEPVGTESSDFENASFRLGVTWRPNEN